MSVFTAQLHKFTVWLHVFTVPDRWRIAYDGPYALAASQRRFHESESTVRTEWQITSGKGLVLRYARVASCITAVSAAWAGALQAQERTAPRVETAAVGAARHSKTHLCIVETGAMSLEGSNLDGAWYDSGRMLMWASDEEVLSVFQSAFGEGPAFERHDVRIPIHSELYAAAMTRDSSVLLATDDGLLEVGPEGRRRQSMTVRWPWVPEAMVRWRDMWLLARVNVTEETGLLEVGTIPLWGGGFRPLVRIQHNGRMTDGPRPRLHLRKGVGSEILLTVSQAPFTTYRLTADGQIRSAVEPDLEALKSVYGWRDIRFVFSGASLSLGGGALQTLTDLRTGVSVLLVHEWQAHEPRDSELTVPIRFLVGDPIEAQLFAVRRLGDPELVRYEWRWSSTVANCAQAPESRTGGLP